MRNAILHLEKYLIMKEQWFYQLFVFWFFVIYQKNRSKLEIMKTSATFLSLLLLHTVVCQLYLRLFLWWLGLRHRFMMTRFQSNCWLLRLLLFSRPALILLYVAASRLRQQFFIHLLSNMLKDLLNIDITLGASLIKICIDRCCQFFSLRFVNWPLSLEVTFSGTNSDYYVLVSKITDILQPSTYILEWFSVVYCVGLYLSKKYKEDSFSPLVYSAS